MHRACMYGVAGTGGEVMWRQFAAGMAAAFLLGALGACASDTDYSNITATSLAVPDTTLLVQSDDLRVAPLDVLEIKVFGVDELNGTYQVDPDGKIKVPLVGIVDAKGYTIFELAHILETKLGESFLQNPQVSIRTTEAFGQQLTVEGAVSKPGMYPVRGRLTLMQAVAISGGPAPSANPNRVIIFRTIEGKRHAAAFDLLKIRAGQSEDPPVYGNDIIVMDGSTLKAGWDVMIRSIPLLGLFVAAG